MDVPVTAAKANRGRTGRNMFGFFILNVQSGGSEDAGRTAMIVNVPH